VSDAEQLPDVAEWMAPAADLWKRADELVKGAQAALTLLLLAGALLYAGAWLERRQLKAHLRVLDGGEGADAGGEGPEHGRSA
jgi:hypothetical protein